MSAVAYDMHVRKFAGRVRAEFGGQCIADTDRAIELLEGQLHPVIYFPREDVRMDLLVRTTHTTYCPFKGNASYWTLEVGDRAAQNVVWSYETPYAEAEELREFLAFYVDQLDHWYVDETEIYRDADRVEGPYANPLLSWVLSEAPFLENPEALTLGLARQLVRSGLPIWRMNVVVRTLHPQILGYAYRYSASSGQIETMVLSHAMLQSPQYLASPLVPLWEGAGGVRRRLDIADPVLDYPVLHDLHAEGATDYVGMPLIFSDGQPHALTLSTNRPGGFTTRELGHLYEVLAVMARLYESHARRSMSLNLLDTYLGRHTGERVLEGQIRRGDGEDIRALIWFCDLRQSSTLAQMMDRQAFLAMLNSFYDCLAGAVLDNGGEVLRFIGDAALAIFPLDEADSDATYDVDARERALSAVADASARIAALNEARATRGEAPLGYGIGLHAGDLTYGNIGTDQRLEFTVIGDAANFAARIEDKTKALGVPVVFSESFVAPLKERFAAVGEHELRGIAGSHTLYTSRGDLT